MGFLTSLAAFFGGAIFKGLLRYLILPIALIGFGYFAVTKIVNVVSKTVYQSNQYEKISEELNTANEQLAEKDKQHADELARLEADRIKQHAHHVQFERRAIRENSKLKQALANDQENEDWFNSLTPNDIDRLLREYTKAAGKNQIFNQLESASSTGRR